MFTIGRDTSCDITVNEASVSRRHAELRPEGEGYVLCPTGSTPTVLNNLPLAASHVLQEGDTFLIGTMKFVLTRERLPIAMAIARSPVAPSSNGVDERRLTLTFSKQEHPERPAGGRRRIVWLVLAAAFGVAVYWLYAVR